MRQACLLAFAILLGEGPFSSRDAYAQASASPPQSARITVRPAVAAAKGKSGASVFDFYYWAYIECNVDGAHYCDANLPIEVPDYLLKNWQACKEIFAEKARAGSTSGPSFSQSKFFVEDPVDPVGFLHSTIVFHVDPSSRLRLENVGFKLIDIKASVSQRAQEDCKFPR